MNYADTGTCATPGSEKSFTLADFERAADLMRWSMPPEPIGQWMRSKGRPPEQWTLVVPEKMFLLDGPVFLPSYVIASPVADHPVFIRKGAI